MSAFNLRVLLVLMLTWGLSSCRTIDEDSVQTSLSKIANLKKSSSLEHWQDREIDQIPAEQFARRAVVLIVPSSSVIRVKEETHSSEAVKYDLRIGSRDQNRPFSAGSAFPITRDGYFLTASHCLDEGKMILLGFNRESELTASDVRVVWRGKYEQGGPDFALIHSRMNPTYVLRLAPWMDDEELIQQHVLTAGYGGQVSEHQTVLSAGGVIDRTSPTFSLKEHSQMTWRLVRHTAPIAPGDSGGPLLNELGEVIGVNSHVSAGFLGKIFGREMLLGYHSVSVNPNPEWIRAMIVLDRIRRRETRG